MSSRKVYAHIDAHTKDFVKDLIRLVKQPSVSATSEGIQACAKLVVKMMQEAGLSTKIFTNQKGNPVVYGEKLSKESSKTLLFL